MSISGELMVLEDFLFKSTDAYIMNGVDTYVNLPQDLLQYDESFILGVIIGEPTRSRMQHYKGYTSVLCVRSSQKAKLAVE